MEAFRGSFSYQNLATAQSLRLVTIESGGFDDPVHCTLRHVDIDPGRDDQPRYEALSYVWGDPQVTKPIMVNGLDFPVTTNLLLALRYLRRQDEARTFWIDAICINQRDIQERNQQVTRMTAIYRHAHKVVLWVGEDMVAHGGWRATVPAEQLFDRLINADRELEAQEPLDQEMAEWGISFMGFINRPWFQRMWVIQESVVNIITEITCGRAAVPWFAFLWAVDSCAPLLRLPVHAGPVTIHHMANVTALSTCFTLARSWRHTNPLPDEIGHCIVKILFALDGKFDSTDPRDRLYAILGLIPGASESLAAAGLPVDYSRSAADVFRQLAVYLITQRRSLDILAAYGADQDFRLADGFANLPSWVPDWGNAPCNTFRPLLQSRLDDETYRGDRVCEFRFSNDSRTLFLRGAALGEIATCGEMISLDSPVLVMAEQEDRALRLKEQFRRWEGQILASPFLERKYHDTEQARKAWLECLFHPEEDGVMRTQHVCYELLVGHIDMSVVAEEDREAVEAELRSFSTFQPLGMNDKLPFVISSGHMGIFESNETPEIGDLVCIFLGGAVPLVIRPVEGAGSEYEFIGACYVPGLMGLDEQHVFLDSRELVEFALV